MVKKKDPNRATKACPKPPGANVPYARVPMSAKKPTLSTKIPILLGIGWLIFHILYPFIATIFWPFDDPLPPLFLHVIITIVSFLAIGVWSFRASKPNERAIVGGILVVIAAVFSLITGSMLLWSFHSVLSWTRPLTGFALVEHLTRLVIGFFSLIGFALGLAAGIKSYRRKQFQFATLGTSLLVLTGLSYFLHGIVIVLGGYYPWFFMGFSFGTPIVGLALLGLVFVVTGKQGFTPARNT